MADREVPFGYHLIDGLLHRCPIADGAEACAYDEARYAAGDDTPPPAGMDLDDALFRAERYGESTEQVMAAYACTYGCECPGACAPQRDPYAGTCGCPCHNLHVGRALEDGTFANCPCHRWDPSQLLAMTREYWAESGQEPPAYALRAARKG